MFGGWRGPGCPSWRCVALPGKQRMSGAFLALLAAACSDPYRCETIGLDGREAEAHGTLEVSLRDWKLSTERVFLTSRDRGSGVSMSACDDHDGHVRMFRSVISVPVPGELPSAFDSDGETGKPSANGVFTYCTDSECPDGGYYGFGTIDTRFEGEVLEFDPEAGIFKADFKAIAAVRPYPALHVRADFTWNSEYVAPAPLPALSGTWLYSQKVPADAGSEETYELRLVQTGQRVTGEFCHPKGEECVAVTGYISESVLRLFTERGDWPSGVRIAQDVQTQELVTVDSSTVWVLRAKE